MGDSLDAFTTDDPAKSAAFLPHLDEPAAGRAFFIHHALRAIARENEIDIIDEQVRGMAVGIWDGLEEKIRNLWILSAVNARALREECLCDGEADSSKRYMLTGKKGALSRLYQEKATKAFKNYRNALMGDYAPPSSPEVKRPTVTRPESPIATRSKDADARYDSAVASSDDASTKEDATVSEKPSPVVPKSPSHQKSASSDLKADLSADASEFKPLELAHSVKQQLKSVTKKSPNDWMQFSLDGRDLFLYHALTIICQDMEQENVDEYVQEVAMSMWSELPRQTKREWSDDTRRLLHVGQLERDDLLSTKAATPYSKRYRITIIRLLADRNEGELKYLEKERDRLERQEERRRLRAQGRAQLQGRTFTPPQQGRMFTPPQQGRAYTPPQHGRTFTPPQQGRMFTPSQKRNTPTPPMQPTPPPHQPSSSTWDVPHAAPWASQHPQHQSTPPSESEARWDAPQASVQTSWSADSTSQPTQANDGGWDAPRKVPGRNPWAAQQQSTAPSSDGWDAPKKVPGKNPWTASKPTASSKPQDPWAACKPAGEVEAPTTEGDGWQTTNRKNKNAKGEKW